MFTKLIFSAPDNFSASQYFPNKGKPRFSLESISNAAKLQLVHTDFAARLLSGARKFEPHHVNT